ncbi:MAG: molybdopterin molybdotransferase MoeA [Candidatus Rifleibacteriota bacterium]
MKTLIQKPVCYEEALSKILAEAKNFKSEIETVPLQNAVNHILAEDIVADTDYPAIANSSMDGFCVHSSDIADASHENPITLPTVSGIDAGSFLDELPQGKCAYIATGAPVPPGADAVVRLEEVDADFNSSHAVFRKAVKAGNFIRPQGSELKAGQIICRKSKLIDPFIVGIAASAGLSALKVFRKPRIAVLTSGDELVMPWDIAQPWQTRNANTAMLVAQVHEAGGEAIDMGIARDANDHARNLFFRAVDIADIVVTSGGISKGRKDPFRNLFEELEIEPVVYGVKIKPGKPLFFGHYKSKPVFALPGNQVASAVSFELFVRSYIRHSLNLPPTRQTLNIRLKSESKNSSGRDFFERGYFVEENGELFVQPISKQESHMLSGFSQTEVLYLHPAEVPVLNPGESVKCFLLRNQR